MKRCSKCKEEKELSFFYRDSANKDGRCNWCASCYFSYTKNKIKYSKQEINDYIKNNNITTKECEKCKNIKELSFFKNYSSSKDGKSSYCKTCLKPNKKNKKYAKEEIDQYIKIYNITTKKCISCNYEKDLISFFSCKRSKDGKRSICKECFNKKQYKNKRSENIKQRRNTDPCFKIRVNISQSIWNALKRNNASKNRKSCLDHLPFTIKELKTHIEKQFEPWMNWNNNGYYTKGWNDNDPSTWKWQIDHIVPHSEFKYTSMDCEEFKKCWDLSNLRPYSAKQNVLDGTSRSRHKINST